MLFANSQVVGTFKGFSERGLEFAAEIVAPYDATMMERPQLGQFLLIELASEEEAALGRITRFVPSGLLATAEGEDYVNTMQRRRQPVPEDLKQQRLKYRVQVKLLGAVRHADGGVIYVPSQRRLPHLGARVALPSSAVLQELCRLSGGTTELGNFVLGEFSYCGTGTAQASPALRSMDPPLIVTFDISHLVSRRSVVFARAGYGKSNLIKFLMGELYRETPRTLTGRPVGTLIFDADGEYFWPDVIGNRPGLCDVPQLRDRLVVFTNRTPPSSYYGSWRAGSVRLDIRQLRARDVIGIAISPERQEQQNILKLKAVTDDNWRRLVDLVQSQGLQATDADIGALLGYSPTQIATSAAEIAAARSNMAQVVRVLHDPESQLLQGSLWALSQGAVVVVDISLLSSAAGNMLAGLLLRRIFSHNQENFTGGSDVIPTVAVIEEAQSVLGRRLEESSPFVEWVKEGRKYDLGAILITQQPGSMAPELLSQADNWFTFHLLSEGDAETLGKYNAHFSNDILAHLIAEPISGNCFMWSAPHQPFVLPVRVRSFEELYRKNINKDLSAASVDTLANHVLAGVREAHERLADLLRERLRGNNVKKYRIPSDGAGMLGVKTGQLFFIIQEIKQSDDTATEEQLKLPLMQLIFGEKNLTVKSFQGTDYYCAPDKAWQEALGHMPAITELPVKS